jgi:L-threonylcarbamoyladenylate synthase
VTTVLTTSPTEAAEYIRRGKTAAFPTETVYGLGADALRRHAVRAIFEAKGRPADNPLIVHVASVGQVGDVAAQIPEAAQQLMDRFWPGPLTVILPKSDAVPDVTTAGLPTVGVRMPEHSLAAAFLAACDTPVAAPSANRSGRPSPTTWQAVRDDLGGRIDCILKGGRTDAGVESTVVDCTAATPIVLRPGAVSVEALREVLPAVDVETSGDDARAETVRSPGTRHRHYAPRAGVTLVTDPDDAVPSPDAAYIGLAAPADASRFATVRVAPSVDAYAHDLFHFFRTCDREGAAVIYAQLVPDDGLGRALNDRLRRAAAG